MAGSKCDARKFAKQIRIFGRERRSPVDRHRVFAVRLLNRTNATDSEIKAFIPSHRPKPARAAHQRSEQTIWMPTLHVALHTLRAKHAPVEGKIFPRLETDDLILSNFELDATLLSAEATM